MFARERMTVARYPNVRLSSHSLGGSLSKHVVLNRPDVEAVGFATGSSPLDPWQYSRFVRCKLPGAPDYCGRFKTYALKNDIVPLAERLLPTNTETMPAVSWNPLENHSIDALAAAKDP